jgi:amino acid transporter
MDSEKAHDTDPVAPSDHLQQRSIGLAGAVVQSAAMVGPTGGLVLGLVFISSLAGGATPLSFVLCLAAVIGEYAKRLPAAGSFYTYLTRTFGARVGFVTGTLLFGAYLLLFPFQLDFFGVFASSLGQAHGVDVPWWVYSIALISLSSGLAVAGIKPTLRLGLITLAFETLVIAVLAAIVVAKGGADGNTVQAFNPATNTHGTSNLLLSVVYTLFAFVGFESAATLGEEAREPRRTIPRAIMISTVIVGGFFVFTSYAAVIGFGVSDAGMDRLAADSSPLNTLAVEYGGETLSALVNAAVIVSIVALNVVTVPAAARMLFSMGRDRVLPSALGRLNRRESPQVAVAVIYAVVLTASLVLGWIWGPENIAAWSSFFATLFFIGAYAMLCVGIFFFIRSTDADAFSWLTHAAVPGVGLAGILWVLWGNVHPLPPSPLRYFIWATVASAVVMAGVAAVLQRRNPDVMIRAGRIFADADATDEGTTHG